MPFGLTNAHAAFQSMINHIFRDMLDQGTVAFMDDIGAHHATLEGQDRILLEVLCCLSDNLCTAPDKRERRKDRIEPPATSLPATEPNDRRQNRNPEKDKDGQPPEGSPELPRPRNPPQRIHQRPQQDPSPANELD